MVQSMDQKPKQPSEINLKDILIQSVKETKSTGTSTFVAVKLREKEPIVDGLNLGDSGYMIVRANEVNFRTKEQQYKFNHPFQCGTNYKLPYHAAALEHRVMDNDHLVVATDGVFDNLSNTLILECFEKDSSTPDVLSSCIANKAEKYSKDKTYDSPFAKNARENGKYYQGGK